MTKDRVYVYARKLQGLVKRARETEANIDDGEGFKALLTDIDPAKALEVSKMIADQRGRLEQMVVAVHKESRRDGLGGAEELLTDITTSLTLAERAYDEWRLAKQEYELASRLGSLDPAEVKAHNDRITAVKDRYGKAVEMASDLVPNPGVIQL